MEEPVSARVEVVDEPLVECGFLDGGFEVNMSYDRFPVVERCRCLTACRENDGAADAVGGEGHFAEVVAYFFAVGARERETYVFQREIDEFVRYFEPAKELNERRVARR